MICTQIWNSTQIFITFVNSFILDLNLERKNFVNLHYDMYIYILYFLTTNYEILKTEINTFTFLDWIKYIVYFINYFEFIYDRFYINKFYIKINIINIQSISIKDLHELKFCFSQVKVLKYYLSRVWTTPVDKVWLII